MKFDTTDAYPKNPQLHVLKLPSEVTSLILRHLDPRSLINASHVCHYWSDICAKDPILRRRIRKREKMHKRFRWSRAKYGDGVIKNNKLYKGSTAVSFKQNARMAQLNLLKALIELRNMWQELYDRLLALT